MNEFEQALAANMHSYDVQLSNDVQHQLNAYYNFLMRWNPRLHLVAPCSAEEFATRHVLESLVLLKHLDERATIADIGSGGGLPIVPLLIARPNLSATLIESSQKKAVFLREVLNHVDRLKNASIINQPFEEIEPINASSVTCRALDQFVDKIPTVLDWAKHGSQLLLFGGESLGERLQSLNAQFVQYLIPLSEKRFLFVVR